MHSVRYESRDELERGVEEMRSRDWVLWRVVGVPENALIASFIRRSSPVPSRKQSAEGPGSGPRGRLRSDRSLARDT